MSQPLHSWFQLPAGPFQPTWDSLERYTPPDWYVDGKFGIFIHWGVYSVPAFGNEWYPRNMYRAGTPEFDHHVATHGPQSRCGYKDFIPRFTASRFDPDEWAALFAGAGARFVVPVAEHHDGFAMYDCARSDWTAAKLGPRRDVIGELARAVRTQQMVFGVSSHRAEHWWFFDEGRKFDSDVRDERYAGLYGPAEPRGTTPSAAYLDDWLWRCCELVDKYEPQLFWFDWWIEQPAFAPYLQRFAAYYYNRGYQWHRGVAINYKHQAFPARAAVFDVERGQLTHIRPRFWQTDTSVATTSWGYIEGQVYKPAASLIGDLVDIVSKGGALLLNIGPRPDGTIPEPEQALLLAIGQWLRVNGEAVYGTRPWLVYGEGPTAVIGGSFADTRRAPFTARDVRFTCTDDALYATVLAEPAGQLAIHSLGTHLRLYPGEIGAVSILGHQGPVAWTRDESALRVTVPAELPCRHALVVKITPR